MPAVVIAAFLNCLKPSIGPMRCLMLRWSCSIKLFRYFEERSFGFAGNEPSAFSSRTARCEAAQAIQRDRLRHTLVLDRFADEGLGRSDVPFGAQVEVDCPARPVDSAVQVAPLASRIFTYVSSTRQDRPTGLPNRFQRLTNSGA